MKDWRNWNIFFVLTAIFKTRGGTKNRYGDYRRPISCNMIIDTRLANIDILIHIIRRSTCCMYPCLSSGAATRRLLKGALHTCKSETWTEIISRRRESLQSGAEMSDISAEKYILKDAPATYKSKKCGYTSASTALKGLQEMLYESKVHGEYHEHAEPFATPPPGPPGCESGWS